jgi:hypothetical protein
MQNLHVGALADIHTLDDANPSPMIDGYRRHFLLSAHQVFSPPTRRSQINQREMKDVPMIR